VGAPAGGVGIALRRERVGSLGGEGHRVRRGAAGGRVAQGRVAGAAGEADREAGRDRRRKHCGRQRGHTDSVPAHLASHR
jgi:hypothetical protein